MLHSSSSGVWDENTDFVGSYDAESKELCIRDGYLYQESDSEDEVEEPKKKIKKLKKGAAYEYQAFLKLFPLAKFHVNSRHDKVRKITICDNGDGQLLLKFATFKGKKTRVTMLLEDFMTQIVKPSKYDIEFE